MSESSKNLGQKDRSSRGWAIVTGGNRGLGFETCKQLGRKGISVILTARNEAQGREAAERLKREGMIAEFRPLDVSRSESIDQFVRQIKSEGKAIDILVNNAGVLLDNVDDASSMVSRETLRQTMET